MYEIKDNNGIVRFTCKDSDSANGYYRFVRNEIGYAEVWHNGECVFKTF